MNDKAELAAMTVELILKTWPRAARVFYAYKMACVGCVLAPYYTLAEAVHIYQLPLDEFLNEVLTVIGEEIGTQTNNKLSNHSFLT